LDSGDLWDNVLNFYDLNDLNDWFININNFYKFINYFLFSKYWYLLNFQIKKIIILNYKSLYEYEYI